MHVNYYYLISLFIDFFLKISTYGFIKYGGKKYRFYTIALFTLISVGGYVGKFVLLQRNEILSYPICCFPQIVDFQV